MIKMSCFCTCRPQDILKLADLPSTVH